MNLGKVFKNGIIDENPTFVQVIGMCPTLAVTSAAINGLGMGLSTTVVLACSNVAISLLRKVIPDKIRIPAFIVVIATFPVSFSALSIKSFAFPKRESIFCDWNENTVVRENSSSRSCSMHEKILP